jgi:hypothetical protein
MRDKNLKPRFVRAFGHYGRPQIGLVASRRRGELIDIIVTPAWPGAPVERVTVRASLVKSVSPANTAAIPDDKFVVILQNLIDAGALTRAERQVLLRERKRAMREALKRRTHIPYYWPWHEPHNIGKGQIAKDFIKMHGIGR